MGKAEVSKGIDILVDVLHLLKSGDAGVVMAEEEFGEHQIRIRICSTSNYLRLGVLFPPRVVLTMFITAGNGLVAIEATYELVVLGSASEGLALWSRG